MFPCLATHTGVTRLLALFSLLQADLTSALAYASTSLQLPNTPQPTGPDGRARTSVAARGELIEALMTPDPANSGCQSSPHPGVRTIFTLTAGRDCPMRLRITKAAPLQVELQIYFARYDKQIGGKWTSGYRFS